MTPLAELDKLTETVTILLNQAAKLRLLHYNTPADELTSLAHQILNKAETLRRELQ
jgi:hypothetical protein